MRERNTPQAVERNYGSFCYHFRCFRCTDCNQDFSNWTTE
ncbi:LIM domain-containing protein [Lactobacillus crispatus]